MIPLSPRLNSRKGNRNFLDILNELVEVDGIPQERVDLLLQDLAERNGMNVEEFISHIDEIYNQVAWQYKQLFPCLV